MNWNNDTNEANKAGIYAHSILAKFYKFRPPYLDVFFNELSLKLGIKSEERILDLCCGKGELAKGFSKLAGEIYAVDGSPEMLSDSFKDEKIIYHLCNVNSGTLPFDEKFNYILIGTAIHWIRDYALTPIVNHNLLTNGRICIIHRSLDFDEQDFNESLRWLNSKYGKKIDYKPDFSGADKMKKCGLIEVDRLSIEKTVSFDLKYLYLNQLSLAYGTFQNNVIMKPDAYKNEFIETISPYVNDGRLSGRLTNNAIIYQVLGVS